MKGGGSGDRHHIIKDGGGGAIVMHSGGGNKHQVPKSKSSFFLTTLLIYILLPVLVLYVVALAASPFYSSPRPCPPADNAAVTTRLAATAGSGTSRKDNNTNTKATPVSTTRPRAPTRLRHIVFGLGGSASLWKRRKEYIKVWWRPGQMRGFVWLDKPVPELHQSPNTTGLPPIRISATTSSFPYTHGAGSRSALRITRIVSETYRLRLPGARWFVMGDDDTVFFPDNLVSALSALDHTQPYYVGSPSESHVQNLIFSYGMAFGGGGFAVSAALARELSRMQDGCVRRYPALYGSDDRVHACVAELGVPLTRHPGFHQCDLWGDVLGLLAAHPVAPLVTLHHLDFLKPVFPAVRSRTAALRRLFDGPVALDPAGVAQQSVCYDAGKEWTVSVSWGFAVVVVRGVVSPREMETPMRTFLNWYRRGDYRAYAFNTRPMARQPCQRPQVYYMRRARMDPRANATVTEYERHRAAPARCRWRIPDPAALMDRVVVVKKPDPDLWKRSPRRNCCRVLSSPKKGKGKTMTIDVGVCRDGEFPRVSS